MIVSELVITYSDVLTKQLVQDWGDAHNQDAEESITMHFEQRRFALKEVRVETARIEGELLFLQIGSDLWSAPREFALTPEGSLLW